MTYGIPLSSATLAYYLTTKNHSVKDVVTGFVVGGFVLVVGDALLGVTVTHFFADDSAIDRSMLGHLLRNITLGGGLVVGAGIGTFSAALKDRF